jgi:hypothetical protein
MILDTLELVEFLKKTKRVIVRAELQKQPASDVDLIRVAFIPENNTIDNYHPPFVIKVDPQLEFPA